MGVTKKHRAEPYVIEIKGSFTLPHIAEIKKTVAKAVRAADRIVVEMRGVTDVDLSGLQLLCATHRSTIKAGKHLSFSAEPPEVMRQVADKAGYLGHKGCENGSGGGCPLWGEVAHD